MRTVSKDHARPSGGQDWLRACRTALIVALGLLAPGTVAHASYYEANAPYRFGTGGATIGEGIDAAGPLFSRGGDPAYIPAPVQSSSQGRPDPFGTGINSAGRLFRRRGEAESVPGPVPNSPKGAMDSFSTGIDAATGAFRMAGQLASIPGRVPIDVKWSFNSQDNSSGPLGTGTSLSTDYFIAASAVLGSGYYELQAPESRHFAFRSPLGNGTYSNSTDPEVLGATLTFASPPNGLTATLRWKDGRTFYFDAAGQLYRKQDRLGNYLTISRNASGYPTQITQPSGRSVTGVIT